MFHERRGISSAGSPLEFRRSGQRIIRVMYVQWLYVIFCSVMSFIWRLTYCNCWLAWIQTWPHYAPNNGRPYVGHDCDMS